MTSIRCFSIFLIALVSLGLTSCNKGLVSGDKLNDFFPEGGGNHSVIVTTEKRGFAQASLRAGRDEEVATFAISDLLKDQEATQKFDESTEKLSGYPLISRGDAGTAVLAGRFQVQVRSKLESFTEADRKNWLGKFDLTGLAGIK